MTIFNEDCLTTVKQWPDNYIDLTVTSPPYNINLSYSAYQDNKRDYLVWLNTRLQEIFRVSKAVWLNLGYRKTPNGNIPIMFDVWPMVRGSMCLMQHIVWSYGAGTTHKRHFNVRKEDWLWLVKDKKDYVFNPDAVRDPKLTKYKKDKRNNPLGKLPGDVWYYPKVKGNSRKRKNHPAQWPSEMITRIILACSNPGAKVYDPFGGSGVLYRTAKKLGREPYTSEVDPKYCEMIIT